MKLEKQLTAFYSMLDYKPISSKAIAMYHVFLQVACMLNWPTKFKLANKTIISKVKDLNESSLKRARNELIVNKYITYKKGSNQNDAPQYTVIKLYQSKFELADEQPNALPNTPADEPTNEHIITILDCYFNYINNSGSKKFGNITEKDKFNLIETLIRLDLFVRNEDALYPMTVEAKQDLKLQYWILKELYFSAYKVYLNKLTREQFLLRFHKSKKYVDPNENIYKFLNYAIKSIQQDFYKEKGGIEVRNENKR